MSLTLNNVKKASKVFKYGLQLNANGIIIIKQAKIFEILKNIPFPWPVAQMVSAFSFPSGAAWDLIHR